MPNLVELLAAKGFTHWATGGQCQALKRQRYGATDVITDLNGSWLPTAEDWQLCTYAYDWADDPGAEEPIDSLCSDTSPVTLLEAVDMATAFRFQSGDYVRVKSRHFPDSVPRLGQVITHDNSGIYVEFGDGKRDCDPSLVSLADANE